jgi:hypothetical protein
LARQEEAQMRKKLPIGTDDFRKIRESGKYYVDKTLIIRDFIERGEEVALVIRPRRFGKTLNMTTLREFFDITKDSRPIFEGLAIMDTEYAEQINTRPVVYMTFKDCKGNTLESLLYNINAIVLQEYYKYYHIFKGSTDEDDLYFFDYFMHYEKLRSRDIDINFITTSISTLTRALHKFYNIRPVILIDEYDQPIISSYQYGYHDHLTSFFSGFYGQALKSQESLHQAMLTGIQRVVKESIFSQLNNVRVYTVVDEKYSAYFGLTENETAELLACYGLELGDEVKERYDGYLFHKAEMYNPWSILNYADTGLLRDYWINTSTNYLVRKSIAEADEFFRENFDRLIAEGTVKIAPELGCSFIELQHDSTLWGLLINAGYLTVVEIIDDRYMTVRIPNGEVRSEFLTIVSDMAHLQSAELTEMFRFLLAKDLDGFMSIYRKLVLNCTSYHDAKENAYHMLFLGMSFTLGDLYKITSNIETGHGRSDIRMESRDPAARPHIVIEFKQGEDVDRLKEEALAQISENEYLAGLAGEVLCLGIAHDKKKCELACKTLTR